MNMSSKTVRFRCLILTLTMLTVVSCTQNSSPLPAPPPPAVLQQHDLTTSRQTAPNSKRFTRVPADVSGIDFRHAWNPPEEFAMQLNSYACTTGVAIGDYDGDGLPDLFLASQTDGGKLYRNRGNFQFEDVTEDQYVDQPSGIRVFDITIGDGATPDSSQTVDVHYTGWLVSDGCVFDSSYSRGSAISFPVSGVIPGFRDAILGMSVGGQRRVYIPADQGYGAQGAGNAIPPNADLIFDITLEGVR